MRLTDEPDGLLLLFNRILPFATILIVIYYSTTVLLQDGSENSAVSVLSYLQNDQAKPCVSKKVIILGAVQK